MKKLILITSLSLFAFTAFAETELDREFAARAVRAQEQAQAEWQQQELNEREQERLRIEARKVELATSLIKVQEQLGRLFNASVSKPDEVSALVNVIYEQAKQKILFSNETVCELKYYKSLRHGGPEGTVDCYTNSNKQLKYKFDEKFNLIK